VFVLYEVRVQATLVGVSGQLSGGIDLGHNSWAGQCLVKNASMVLGLSSCIPYECPCGLIEVGHGSDSCCTLCTPLGSGTP
jgi:hypothetical protein